MHNLGNHEHGHGDAHTEKGNGEAICLLGYILDHNTHHIEEFDEIITALNNAGEEKVAEMVKESVELFRKANERLADAMDSLQKGKT